MIICTTCGYESHNYQDYIREHGAYSPHGCKVNMPERLADAREICLALAKVCEITGKYEPALRLRRAAEHLYRWHYESVSKAARANAEPVRGTQ